MQKDQDKPLYAYVCFTCKRDEQLLPLHYEAIMRADPLAQVYYQVEDAEADITIPNGAYLLPAPWKHNQNLLGMAALLGMVNTYKMVAENTGRTVVKIDADTILISNNWIDLVGTGKADMVGFSPTTNYYCKGTAYAISLTGINAVLEQLYSGNYWENGADRIEDGVISMLCAIGTDKDRVRILQTKKPDNSIILYTVFSSPFYSNPDALTVVKCVIDCGDPKLLNTYHLGRLDPILAKKRAMRFCLHSFYRKKLKKIR